jgi:hypothetical protein
MDKHPSRWDIAVRVVQLMGAFAQLFYAAYRMYQGH